MSTINIIINTIYPILAFLGIMLISHKKKSGFIVFLFVEILMFYLGFISNQFGITTMAVVYFFTNIYGYLQWSKVEK